MTLGLLGFATIAAFLLLILAARVPVLVALVLVPVVSSVIGGHAEEIAKFSIDGLKTVAPVAVMISFAILYFGLMLDIGLFEPIVTRLTGFVADDPVRLCLITATLSLFVALDGDGATTFLISITALLPVHRRLGIQPLVLPTIVGLSAGVMNMLPWGGPTARAMAALGGDVGSVFLPVVPAMLAGIAWVFAVAAWLGLRERRLIASSAVMDVADVSATDSALDVTTPVNTGSRLVWNVLLTIGLLVVLFQDLYRSVVPIPTIPAPLAFMVAFAIALPLNRRGSEAQQAQLAAHAPSLVLVVSMIFAAGIFSGIMSGTGMLSAMATTISGAVPSGASAWLGPIMALLGMPLSLAFTPDAFYFGILPVFAETVRSAGGDPMVMGRAAILGQMTTGFPLSPLTASTFILIGLSGVSLRDHQRHMFGWAFGTTVIMTVAALLTGALFVQ